MKNLQAVRRVLYITLALNLTAMAAKLIVGYATGALSLIADGFDSLFDGASNVIGLVGIYIASRPADREHPYGHRKYETMSAIAIALLLFVTTWELVQSAWERLRAPEQFDLQVNAWSFASLLVSIAVHIIVVVYELRAGRRLKSDVLVADAMHTRADIYISVSVMGGLIAARLGYPIVDPLLALVIAVLILKIGIDIVRTSSQTLLDTAVVQMSEIERIAMGVREVQAVHHIRSRGHEDAVYVDLHIRVAPDMSTGQSHAVAHEVQQRLRDEIPTIEDVVVHVEPEGAPHTEAAPLIPALRRLAAEQGIAVHDITAHRVGEQYRAEAHVTVDGSLPLRQAHGLVSAFEAQARQEIPDLESIVSHIEPVQEKEGAYQSPLTADQLIAQAEKVLDELDGPHAGHDIEAYPIGSGWGLSLHYLLDEDLSLSEGHAISTQIEGRLRDAIPRLDRVIVHIEPSP